MTLKVSTATRIV